MKPREILEDVIRAWEALPGGRNHSRQVIQDWLVQDMKPMVDRMRAELAAMNDPTIRCPHCKAVVPHKDAL